MIQTKYGGDTQLKKAISFRLRKIDEDLIQAIQGIETEMLSNLCRDGLRYMLGLNTTKQVTVQEKPLTRLTQNQNQSLSSNQLKPSVFRPGISNRSDTKRD